MVGALEGLLAAHTTVVIATHDVDFALRWADSVAVLVDGLVRHGSPTQMLGDADLVMGARLRKPLVLQAAVQLSLDLHGIRDIDALVEAVNVEFTPVASSRAFSVRLTGRVWESDHFRTSGWHLEGTGRRPATVGATSQGVPAQWVCSQAP